MSTESLERSPDPDTLAAVNTPPGRGALATVQVRGPDAVRAVACACRADLNKMLDELRAGRLCVTHWTDASGEQIVLHVLGPDHVEINSHGGVMAARSILRSLADRGVCTVTWQELVYRQASSVIEAEATETLARAPTLRTAGVLLDQYRGALATCVTRLFQRLEQVRVDDVSNELERLIDRSALGLHLVEPWRVAIVGRPNVGKSSLLNALVGYERAIVHPTAGTTRDLVSAVTAFGGWPVELVDSAGFRPAVDELEAAGIRHAKTGVAQSNLQLVVLDCSLPLTSEDRAILQLCLRPVIVANKIDLPVAWDRCTVVPGSHAVSAQTGAGLQHLTDRLAALLVPDPPQPGEAVPFTQRQVVWLQEAQRNLRARDTQRAAQALRGMMGDKHSKT